MDHVVTAPQLLTRGHQEGVDVGVTRSIILLEGELVPEAVDGGQDGEVLFPCEVQQDGFGWFSACHRVCINIQVTSNEE